MIKQDTSLINNDFYIGEGALKPVYTGGGGGGSMVSLPIIPPVVKPVPIPEVKQQTMVIPVTSVAQNVFSTPAPAPKPTPYVDQSVFTDVLNAVGSLTGVPVTTKPTTYTDTNVITVRSTPTYWWVLVVVVIVVCIASMFTGDSKKGYSR